MYTLNSVLENLSGVVASSVKHFSNAPFRVVFGNLIAFNKTKISLSYKVRTLNSKKYFCHPLVSLSSIWLEFELKRLGLNKSLWYFLDFVCILFSWRITLYFLRTSLDHNFFLWIGSCFTSYIDEFSSKPMKRYPILFLFFMDFLAFWTIELF